MLIGHSTYFVEAEGIGIKELRLIESHGAEGKHNKKCARKKEEDSNVSWNAKTKEENKPTKRVCKVWEEFIQWLRHKQIKI